MTFVLDIHTNQCLCIAHFAGDPYSVPPYTVVMLLLGGKPSYAPSMFSGVHWHVFWYLHHTRHNGGRSGKPYCHSSYWCTIFELWASDFSCWWTPSYGLSTNEHWQNANVTTSVKKTNLQICRGWHGNCLLFPPFASWTCTTLVKMDLLLVLHPTWTVLWLIYDFRHACE